MEVLRVGVHCEVNLLVEALDVNRVPVLVVQQAAHGDGNAAAAAEPLPVIVCGSTKKKINKQLSALLRCRGRRCVSGQRGSAGKKAAWMMRYQADGKKKTYHHGRFFFFPLKFQNTDLLFCTS